MARPTHKFRQDPLPPSLSNWLTVGVFVCSGGWEPSPAIDGDEKSGSGVMVFRNVERGAGVGPG